MSFDILYHTRNLGTRTAKRKNPFTGKMQSVPVDDGLTDTERADVRKLPRSAAAANPDEFGCYAVEFKDGGSAEVFASELAGTEQCDGLMVSLHGLTLAVVGFLYELCRAGNMAATPIMEEEVVVVASEEQLARRGCRSAGRRQSRSAHPGRVRPAAQRWCCGAWRGVPGSGRRRVKARRTVRCTGPLSNALFADRVSAGQVSSLFGGQFRHRTVDFAGSRSTIHWGTKPLVAVTAGLP